MYVKRSNRIGIVAAMDVEVEAIKSLCSIENEKKIGPVSFYYGTLDEKEIVICKSGVGKGCCAMATTILCLDHDLDALMNIGTAGGLKDDQNVLDIVISDKVVQADFDTSPLDGEEGMGLTFTAENDLIAAVQEAASENRIPFHTGTVASQDLFMSRREDFQKLMERFPDSVCSEMEAGALAQIADAFQVPFVVIRCLSDVAVHDENPMEFTEYVAHASQQSAQLVYTVLKNL
ncbi:5'-methylthioadenosine/adenosylhomocysteine nucleosidase [uncultured Faecalicoccus sp.]|uniref:5'-methylthioadenosine/adenosylhomocysteine nucleosidase n=1 Tax=uncultured Faecalicoccus sp. TaxID=1971760 RepID=UPI00261B42C3|nr:5'-methylthioadenosine/adenosylhomocysteine nucleosidase [uncultured Faecalicoccus sp.]